MRIQLRKIDHGDGTLDLLWQIGQQQYARTVSASDIDTRAKLGQYLLSQMAEIEDSQVYIITAHHENGAWVLDHITADDDRAAGRDDIRNAPGYASWTAAEAEQWIVANVVSVEPGVKTALRAMARMLIYLRDAVL